MKLFLVILYKYICIFLRNITNYSYAKGANKENKLLLKLFSKHKIAKNSKILDIGCGFGRILILLKKEGFSPIGVDANKEIVNSNRKNGLDCINICELNTMTEKVDVIIMSHIIEHLNPADLLVFMDNYLDFLKENGLLIILTPIFSKQFFTDFDHVKPYSHIGINMVFSGKNQVQYYSKNKLEFQNIKYIKVPYNNRTISTRSQSFSIPLKGLIDLMFLLLYYLSFTLIGINMGWLGIFKKEAC